MNDIFDEPTDETDELMIRLNEICLEDDSYECGLPLSSEGLTSFKKEIDNFIINKGATK